MTSYRREPIHEWELPPTNRAIGRLERLAYERHARDLATGPERGFYFDDDIAEFACEFYELLPLTKTRQWAGKPFELLNWERFVVASLLAWVRIDDGLRRIRRAFLQVAKKSGKTELAAGLGNFGLVADQEPGAEIYSVAMKRDQAKLVWDAAGKMVSRSPALRHRCDVTRSSIAYPALGAKFMPLSRDVDSQDGANPSLLIIDEYHRFKNRDLVEMLAESMSVRAEPLEIMTTTAGAGSSGPCFEEREYAEKVLSGIVPDDEYFAFVTEPDEDDEWDSEIAWEKANPSIDILISREFLAKHAARAKETPSKQNDFRRYRCNQWVEQIERAIDMRVWKECGAPFDASALFGRPCFGGLDVASKLDIAAFVLLFPPVGDDPCWYVLPTMWTPAHNLIERGKRDRAPYSHWVEKGWLNADRTGNGETIRPETIEEVVKQANVDYELISVGYDPWKARDIAEHLVDHGITMVEIAQVVSRLTVGTKFVLEDLLPSRLLRHGNHKVLTWMASNFATWSDTNNNVRPSRENSGGKIDGISALVDAACLGAVTKAKKKRSKYATPGTRPTTLGQMR